MNMSICTRHLESTFPYVVMMAYNHNLQFVENDDDKDITTIRNAISIEFTVRYYMCIYT